MGGKYRFKNFESIHKDEIFYDDNQEIEYQIPLL